MSAFYGFIERPDPPALLPEACGTGAVFGLSDTAYFVGHETVVSRANSTGLSHWVEWMFAFLRRNSAHVTDCFRLPADTVVEIVREVTI